MIKYVPRSYEADDAAWEPKVAPSSVVVIVDDEFVDTGLLDVNGVKLYRARRSAGFLANN